MTIDSLISLPVSRHVFVSSLSCRSVLVPVDLTVECSSCFCLGVDCGVEQAMGCG